MFCTNCGAQIPDDSEFCQNCGAKIERDFSYGEQQPYVEQQSYEEYQTYDNRQVYDNQTVYQEESHYDEAEYSQPKKRVIWPFILLAVLVLSIGGGAVTWNVWLKDIVMGDSDSDEDDEDRKGKDKDKDSDVKDKDDSEDEESRSGSKGKIDTSKYDLSNISEEELMELINQYLLKYADVSVSEKSADSRGVGKVKATVESPDYASLFETYLNENDIDISNADDQKLRTTVAEFFVNSKTSIFENDKVSRTVAADLKGALEEDVNLLLIWEFYSYDLNSLLQQAIDEADMNSNSLIPSAWEKLK